jgi:protein TonB
MLVRLNFFLIQPFYGSRMSKDPKTNPPPNGQPEPSLEDLVYRASLAGDRKELKGASKMVTIPVTIVSYAFFGLVAFELAKHTDAGKKILKTVKVDLQEESEAPPPPPPPPPAPPAPPAAVPRVVAEKAPPPPPIDPNRDVVPEVAPRELPKTDRSMAYAGLASGSGTGVIGGGVAAGPSTSFSQTVVGSSQSTKYVEIDFSQIKIKHQPPPPPYPPLAKIARIQGTVVVEISVGADGIPVSAKAIEGPAQLRATAEAYAMGWKFEPAMQNGTPVPARFKLTMPFRLK